jgi:hypothetical protein
VDDVILATLAQGADFSNCRTDCPQVEWRAGPLNLMRLVEVFLACGGNGNTVGGSIYAPAASAKVIRIRKQEGAERSRNGADNQKTSRLSRNLAGCRQRCLCMLEPSGICVQHFLCKLRCHHFRYQVYIRDRGRAAQPIVSAGIGASACTGFWFKGRVVAAIRPIIRSASLRSAALADSERRLRSKSAIPA